MLHIDGVAAKFFEFIPFKWKCSRLYVTQVFGKGDYWSVSISLASYILATHCFKVVSLSLRRVMVCGSFFWILNSSVFTVCLDVWTPDKLCLFIDSSPEERRFLHLHLFLITPHQRRVTAPLFLWTSTHESPFCLFQLDSSKLNLCTSLGMDLEKNAWW